MEIKAGEVNSSQIISNVEGDAKLQIGDGFAPVANNGNQYNACAFYNGPGWDVAKDLGDELLTQAQEHFLTDNDAVGFALLNSLIRPERMSPLPLETQIIISIVYCESLIPDHFSQAINWLDSLEGAIAEDKAIKGWKLWLKFQFQKDEASGQQLTALLDLFPESPVIVNLMLRSNSDAHVQKAISILEETISRGGDLAKWKMSILTLANIYSASSRPDKSLQLLEFVSPVGEVEAYKVALVKASFKVQERLSSKILAVGSHCTKSDWLFFERISLECEDILSRALKRGHLYSDAIALKSMSLSLMGQYESAVSCITPDVVPLLDHMQVGNVASAYQALEDWEGLERFIGQLKPENQDFLHEFKVVALVNQGKIDEARSLGSITSESSKVLEAIESSEESNFEEIDDFSLASQVALNRFKKNGCESALKFLKEYSPLDDYEILIKAAALYECNMDDVSLLEYEKVFSRIEYGPSKNFCNYLKLLFTSERRAQVKSIVDFFPNKIIYNYKSLLIFNVQYLVSCFGAKKAIEFLDTVLKHNCLLWFRIVWMQLNLQVGNFSAVRNKVSDWGVHQEGPLRELCAYISLASHCYDELEIYETLYEVFHKSPGSIEVLKACFGVFFGINLRGKAKELESIDEVVSRCALVFDSKESCLIDDRGFAVSSSLGIHPEDEIVNGWKGKRVGDVVQFNGEDRRIVEIIPCYTWLARRVMDELAKRPKSSSVLKIESPSAEEAVNKIVEYVKSNYESQKDFVEEACKHDAPILTLLTANNDNPIKAWAKLAKNEFDISFPVSAYRLENFSSKVTSQIIFDPSSFSSIFLLSEICPKKYLADIALVAPPSLVTSYRALYNEQLEEKAGTVFWDESSQKLGFIGVSEGKPLQRFEDVLTMLESGEIEEGVSIPEVDIEGEYRQVISLLDECTREAIYCAYGRKGALLISDDKWINNIADILGIPSLTSLELINSLLKRNDSSSDLARSYMQITSGALTVGSLPSEVLCELALGDYSLESIEGYLSGKLESIPFNFSNIMALGRFIGLASESGADLEKLRSISGILISRVHDVPSDKDFLAHILAELTSRLSLPAEIVPRVYCMLAKSFGVEILAFAPFDNVVIEKINYRLVRSRYLSE